jgi:hypothetical protein
MKIVADFDTASMASFRICTLSGSYTEWEMPRGQPPLTYTPRPSDVSLVPAPVLTSAFATLVTTALGSSY